MEGTEIIGSYEIFRLVIQYGPHGLCEKEGSRR